MLEIEVKYRVANHDSILKVLHDLGAILSENRTDADHYFNAPDRDFAKTDEAFRLRRIGPKNRLTYKGPKRDATTKTRTEIEIAVADGDQTAADAEKMLICLGYRSVAVVRKSRRVYHLTRGAFDVEICVDDVERVGTFVEVEIVADDSRYEDAKATVLKLAAELKLTESERRSYLEMLLSATRS